MKNAPIGSDYWKLKEDLEEFFFNKENNIIKIYHTIDWYGDAKEEVKNDNIILA